jgi:hypothetical protein
LATRRHRDREACAQEEREDSGHEKGNGQEDSKEGIKGSYTEGCEAGSEEEVRKVRPRQPSPKNVMAVLLHLQIRISID